MNRLAYDATVDKHRRQPPPSSTKDEDLILKPADRRKLVAQSRDIHRNFTIAGWMIRKHLDYTSTFAFQARTGMPEVDEQMEGLIRWWSRPVRAKTWISPVLQVAGCESTAAGGPCQGGVRPQCQTQIEMSGLNQIEMSGSAWTCSVPRVACRYPQKR